MDVRKIVVVVEDVEESRTALRWALQNLFRSGDIMTLLHVYPSSPNSRNRKKLRMLRLQGYQLALSFKDICNTFSNTNIEIIVTEGDQEGTKITAVVREIGASSLVVGLHGRSFLYKVSMSPCNLGITLNCRILAIKPPATLKTNSSSCTSPTMDFAQIQLSPLHLHIPPPSKIPYRIFPNPSAIIWRPRKSRRRDDTC